jgi:hypothetical protein
MEVTNGEWRASAAYLYVLTLDSISLAWEYLRRNPQYVVDWQSVGQRADPARWRLTAFENPSFDARTAQPIWDELPEGQLRIVRLEDDPFSLTFSLWTVPGRKMLCHDGSRLRLTVEIHGTRAHIAIHPALQSGDSFGLALSSGLPIAQQASRAQTALHVLTSHIAGAVHAGRREALVHMRTLQTLDAVHAKISQRETASSLFGSLSVMRHWHQDGELRARVRHYVHRGRALMRGDYLTLLYPSRRSRRRDLRDRARNGSIR